MARIDHPDPAVANEIALRELENGANGLGRVFAGSRGDHHFGLPANEAALARVLEGVDLTAGIAIEADVSPQAVAVIDAALARGNPLSPAGANLRLGHDPLSAQALAGAAPRPWSELAPHFARRLAALDRLGVRGALAAADGRVIHNAGGSEAQELAFALAVAVATSARSMAKACPLEAQPRGDFLPAVRRIADQFLTIAKFRALRKLHGPGCRPRAASPRSPDSSPPKPRGG